MNVGIGVKAFIVNEGKLLMIRRRANDPHNPNKWDLPGGRIKLGEESPQNGLKRETMEEAGINIEILLPLDVQFFTHQRTDNKFNFLFMQAIV